MALNIKNREVERLAEKLANLSGESKTETVRLARVARREQLAQRVVRPSRGESFLGYLEEGVWPRVPPGTLGERLTKEKEE